MSVTDSPSPNFGPRRDGRKPDLVVLHYTGMASAAEALARMRDPASEVSAHYMIDEDGTCHRLVDEAMRAWHAGVACWAGERDVNSISIGIELVNPGHEHGYRPFPAPQIARLVELCTGLKARHGIAPHRFVGHSDVAPARKQDPGELFPWKDLAWQGFGLWPKPNHAGAPAAPMEAAFLLAEIGYDSADLPASIAAFQRRYRPALIDGQLDRETAGLINGLARMLPRQDALQGE